MSWRIESTRDVEATPEVVYDFYTNPGTWGQWAHHTKGASASGSLAVGSLVDVTDGFGHTWHVTIERLEPGRHVTCVNRDMGFVITSTYDVEPTERGCRIHHVIEMGGRLQMLYRPLQPVYGHLLRGETERLAALASSRRPAAAALPA
jgi:hypothetical protein